MDGLAEADMLDLDLDQVLQAKEFLELHSVLGTECHATETEDLFTHAFRPKQQPSYTTNSTCRRQPNGPVRPQTPLLHSIMQSIT